MFHVSLPFRPVMPCLKKKKIIIITLNVQLNYIHVCQTKIEILKFEKYKKKQSIK